LFNEDACDAVGNFELLPFVLEPVNLLKDYAVGWKVAFTRCAFKHFTVQCVVEVHVEKVAFPHLRSCQKVCMETSAQTEGLMHLKDEADVWQPEKLQLLIAYW
jgi:hypothetical protein